MQIRNALSIVVPCYNEQEVLEGTNAALLAVLRGLIDAGKIAHASCICYVDDGSSDATWSIIEALSCASDHVSGIKLAHNVGHQHALLAGLSSVPGDILVSIDADLQDDVAAIEKMVDAWAQGCEIVYGVREDRSSDTAFKRGTAKLYYKLLARLGGEIVQNHADFRLMSRRAIEALKDYKEANLFLRGMVPLIGLRSGIVRYTRAPRLAGESKYPLRRMLSLAWEGTTSFSVVPLRMVSLLGVLVFFATVLMSLAIVGIRLFTDRAIPGWASTVLPIYLSTGVQILCIGVLGEYLGKIYKEVKARPRFLLERTCGSKLEPSA